MASPSRGRNVVRDAGFAGWRWRQLNEISLCGDTRQRRMVDFSAVEDPVELIAAEAVAFLQQFTDFDPGRE
ncbi:hypothetical protein AB0K68_32505 [Streptomyces sp. NPDC050698]